MAAVWRPPALLSVVVDNYNHERFLGEAIESALAQTGAPVEVIVVDDGSTDGSREVMASFGERITSVCKPNGGQASAFNAGFAASRGDAVFFLDADDKLAPDAAATALRALAEPGVVAVQWPLWEIDADGAPLGVYPAYPLSHGDVREAAIAEGPWGARFSNGGGTAWSRTFLESVMPVPAEFRDFADGYPMALAPLAGKLAARPEPHSYYRYHGGNRKAGPRPLDERLALLRHGYLPSCRAMSAYLTRHGVEHDPDAWARNEAWSRVVHLQEGQEVIRSLVAPGESFILIDRDEWRHHWLAQPVVEGRRGLPFLERDGAWWGLPADSAEAIRELERMRRAGARRLFVGLSGFWWFDYYADWHTHLRSHYPVLWSGEHLIAFDLSGGQLAAAS